jgi:hypothetical protein
MKMAEFREKYPDQPIHSPAVTQSIKDARRPGAPKRRMPKTKGIPVIDPVADNIRLLLDRYKIMVFYRKMSLEEYRMRKEALRDLRMQMGDPEVYSTTWEAMRILLKERDPDLKIPREVWYKSRPK